MSAGLASVGFRKRPAISISNPEAPGTGDTAGRVPRSAARPPRTVLPQGPLRALPGVVRQVREAASGRHIRGAMNPRRSGTYRLRVGAGGGGGSGTFELKMSYFRRHTASGSFWRTSTNFPLSAGIPVSFIQ